MGFLFILRVFAEEIFFVFRFDAWPVVRTLAFRLPIRPRLTNTDSKTYRYIEDLRSLIILCHTLFFNTYIYVKFILKRVFGYNVVLSDSNYCFVVIHYLGHIIKLNFVFVTYYEIETR